LNALYADREGTVFDPLGGLDDLVAGRVRFIGDAEERIKEDYLRILRFFRVHAYYGKGELDAEGLHASVKLRAGLERLSAERVGAELKRLLIAPGAGSAVEALYDYGLLTGLLGGVPLLQRFERLAAIEAALGLAPNAALRLAALAVFIEEDVARLAERLRLSNAEQAVLGIAAGLHPDAHVPEEIEAKELLYRLGAEAYRAHVLLAWAASGAGPDDSNWRVAYALPERWQAPNFPLRGADLTALGLQGPDIGETLRRLERDWIAADFSLGREELLAKARGLIAKP
jgi:poly(A) polymerase